MLCTTTTWATDYNVGTDAELRAAIQNDGANIIVTADIDLSNITLSIESGRTVTIDLGGYTLNRRLTLRGENGGQVITVRNGATLNLSNGTLTGGYGGDGGGLLNEGGTVTLTNVNITGNTADDRGGGISNHGTLTMTGGSITGNTSRDGIDLKGGGGIFNYSGATATLTNVSITGNEAKEKGGGGLCNYGTITLNDCIISGNRAQLNGGGIWDGRVEGKEVSVLIINGCTITGNHAEGKGGGIYGSNVYGDPGHEGLRMEGVVTVTNNTGCGGLSDNLFLDHRKYVYVTGDLTGSNIGVTLEIPPYEFTKEFKTQNPDADITSIFHPDMPDIMTITLSNNNEGYMIKNIPDDVIYYVERAWDDEHKEVTATFKYLTERIDNNATPTSETQYKVLTTTSDAVVHLGTENSELHEFYVVNDQVEVFSLFVDGPNVHIILCDQSQLILGDELRVTEGHTVYIHNQCTEVNMGKIRRTEDGATGCIGGNNDSDTNLNGGNIEIHGGDLDLFCHDGGSAIGGRFKNIGNIKIYGGKIKAESIHGAAGIGGGVGSIYYGNISIYGGTIQAIGSDNMPDLNANGGAGIGGGMGCQGGDLHIYGGTITATTNGETAGIGCGQNGGDKAAGTIIIDGGVVKAHGGDYGAGIGGGDSMNGADLTINGGHVEAYGGTDAAGIGGGEGGDGGTVTINGGYVYAQGGWEYGAGIGGGQSGKGANVTIKGGTVIAKAGKNDEGLRAIGPGTGSNDYGSLTIGDGLMVLSGDGTDGPYVATSRVDHCWYRTQASITPCPHSGAGYTIIDGNSHSVACTYCTTTTTAQPHDFGSYGECDCHLISLANDGDNSSVLEHWNGVADRTFTLSGRTLVRDGNWNTLCLPFTINDYDGTIFEGASVIDLDTKGWYDSGNNRHTEYAEGRHQTSLADDGTLYLYFINTGNIYAGTPYLVKWLKNDDIVNPVFSGITIDNVQHDVTSEDAKVTFTGIYSPKDIAGEDKSLLYLGPDNKFYYPSQAMTINAFRSYFLIDLTDSPAGMREFVMNFEDSNTTGMSLSTNPSTNRDERWYTIDGRKLSGKPTQKGVYINNGIKVVIK